MNINHEISTRLLQIMDTKPLKVKIGRYMVGGNRSPVRHLGLNFEFYWKISTFKRLRAIGTQLHSGEKSLGFYTGNWFVGWEEIKDKFYQENVVTQMHKLVNKTVQDIKDNQAKLALKSLS